MRQFISSLNNIAATVEPEDPNIVNVILLTGQSNAAWSVPIGMSAPADRVYRDRFFYPNGNSWANFDYSAHTTNTGLELAMAVKHDDYFPTKNTYFIQSAIGNTAISNHLPYTSELKFMGAYNAWFYGWSTLVKSLITAGKTPKFWIIWMQGESDAVTQELVDLYDAKWKEEIFYLRKTIAPNCPVFTYQMLAAGDAGSVSRLAAITEIFYNAGLSDSEMFQIPSLGLSDTGDGVHFDFVAQKTMADYIYTTMLAHTNNSTVRPPAIDYAWMYTTSTSANFGSNLTLSDSINIHVVDSLGHEFETDGTTCNFNMAVNTGRGALITFSSKTIQLSNLTTLHFPNSNMEAFNTGSIYYLTDIDVSGNAMKTWISFCYSIVTLKAQNNQLTTIPFGTYNHITYCDISNNLFDAAFLDGLIIALAAEAVSNGYLKISGNAETRTAASDAAKATLIGRSWVVIE